MMGNGTLTPIFSSMFLIQAICDDALSTLRPSNCVLLFFSSSKISENAINSVVQTGVKSAGCENIDDLANAIERFGINGSVKQYSHPIREQVPASFDDGNDDHKRRNTV